MFFSSCTPRADKRPGFLYLRLPSDITSLDPAMIVDVSGGSVAAKIYNGLVRFNENMETVPDLAENFFVSKDGRTYTFSLRKGVRFHNGREFTADDVKRSFERVLHPVTKSSRTWIFDRIEGAEQFMAGTASEVSGIRTIDSYTVAIRLKAPFGPFLNLLAMPPAYIVPVEETEGEKDLSSHPVGTGPFRLKEWKRGREITLVKNGDYFSEAAKINGIVYRVIPEELTAIAEFESGNLDVIGVPSTEFRRYHGSAKWKEMILKAPGLNTFYIGLNCSKPPLTDKRVRQALNYAIDRERILSTLLEGRGEIADGPVPKVLLNIRPTGYRYDPEMARNLLKEAGYEKGLRFRIYQSADQETVDTMEVVQQYLKDVGVEAEIVQLEWSALKEAINKGEADSFWLSWKADYPDAENFLFPVFHSSNMGPAGNRAMFSDREVDRLIEEGQSEPDMKRRAELYSQAEGKVVEAAPWVFFWHKNEYLIRQPWVQAMKVYPIYNADKGTDVRLHEDPAHIQH